MSDTWNIPGSENNPEETPVSQPAVPAEETPVEAAEQPVQQPGTPAEEAAAVPETPAEPAAQEEAPAQPADDFQAPLNGWSSDGSYRYVPPHNPQPPVPPRSPYTGQAVQTPAGGYGQTPYPTYGTQPPYQSPAGGYSWTPPTGGAQPTPPTGGQKPPKKGRGWIVVVALLGVLAVLASVVLVVFAAMQGMQGIMEPNDNPSRVDTESGGVKDAPSLEISKWDDDDGGLSTKEVVNRNYDSTVVISIYTQSKNFNFGESTLIEAGSASGIIMSADGYVITNWHCVINESTGQPYDRIDVTTYDGKTYEDAQVIGSDESTDLAVIKIKASGLKVAQFGDSDELAVGDRVIALGNAAGLSWTATQGIVSARARDVYDDTGYAIKCLQVDAAINPGNSGGPLLNKQGLVVGINSAKIAANGYEGLGFSIPINEAKTIIDSLLQHGYIKGRVALGITGQTYSSGMYNGFLIATIEKGSSLEGTQAQPGDLIVAVDNQTVVDYGELRAALASHKVGDQVTLRLLRSDGRTGQVRSFNVTVTLKEQGSK